MKNVIAWMGLSGFVLILVTVLVVVLKGAYIIWAPLPFIGIAGLVMFGVSLVLTSRIDTKETKEFQKELKKDGN